MCLRSPPIVALAGKGNGRSAGIGVVPIRRHVVATLDKCRAVQTHHRLGHDSLPRVGLVGYYRHFGRRDGCGNDGELRLLRTLVAALPGNGNGRSAGIDVVRVRKGIIRAILEYLGSQLNLRRRFERGASIGFIGNLCDSRRRKACLNYLERNLLRSGVVALAGNGDGCGPNCRVVGIRKRIVRTVLKRNRAHLDGKGGFNRSAGIGFIGNRRDGCLRDVRLHNFERGLLAAGVVALAGNGDGCGTALHVVRIRKRVIRTTLERYAGHFYGECGLNGRASVGLIGNRRDGCLRDVRLHDFERDLLAAGVAALAGNGNGCGAALNIVRIFQGEVGAVLEGGAPHLNRRHWLYRLAGIRLVRYRRDRGGAQISLQQIGGSLPASGARLEHYDASVTDLARLTVLGNKLRTSRVPSLLGE